MRQHRGIALTVLSDATRPDASAGNVGVNPGDFRVERRWLGRVTYTNPELVGLSRGSAPLQTASLVEAVLPEDQEDPLRAMRGILLALLIGVSFWIAIAAAIWMWA